MLGLELKSGATAISSVYKYSKFGFDPLMCTNNLEIKMGKEKPKQQRFTG